MPLTERDKQWRAIRRLDEQGMLCCAQTLAKRYLSKYPNHGAAWLVYGTFLCDLARYEEALVALRQAARLCPADKLHWVQLRFGELYRRKGNYRRAESWFRRSIASCPAEATSYVYLGGMLARAGRLSEAEAIHRQATLCAQGCIDEAFLNLGLVLRAQGRYAEARACFLRALEIDPKYKDAKKELADVQRAIELGLDGQPTGSAGK